MGKREPVTPVFDHLAALAERALAKMDFAVRVHQQYGGRPRAVAGRTDEGGGKYFLPILADARIRQRAIVGEAAVRKRRQEFFDQLVRFRGLDKRFAQHPLAAFDFRPGGIKQMIA